MTRRNQEGREQPEESLAARLRQGDPAADGRDLEPIEVAQLRRRLLAAAADSYQTSAWRWRPASAATAAAALAAIVALAVILATRPPGSPSTDQTVESPRQDLERQTARHQSPEPGPQKPARPAEAKTTARSEPRAATAVADAEAPAVASRQLQFSTPGGTRIVWVLNPDYLESGSANHPVDGTEL